MSAFPPAGPVALGQTVELASIYLVAAASVESVRFHLPLSEGVPKTAVKHSYIVEGDVGKMRTNWFYALTENHELAATYLSKVKKK